MQWDESVIILSTNMPDNALFEIIDLLLQDIKGGKNMNMIYTVAIKEKLPNSRIKSRTKTQK